MITSKIKNIWHIFKNPVGQIKRFLKKTKRLISKGDLSQAQLSSRKTIELLVSTETQKFLKNNRCLSNTPDFDDVLLSICTLYAKVSHLTNLESLDKIIEKIKLIIRLYGEKLSFICLLGELAYLQNNYRESLTYFKRIYYAHENDPLIKFWIARLNFKLKNHRDTNILLGEVELPIKSTTIKEKILFNDPDKLSMEYLNVRALNCFALKDWGASKKYLRLLEKNYAINPASQYFLSKAYLKTCNYTKALDLINKCLDQESENSKYLLQRGCILKQIGKLTEAEKDLKKCLLVKSENSEAHYQLALVLSFQNKSDDALKYFNKAIQLNPNDFRYYLKKGILYEKRHFYEQAVNSYLTSLKFDNLQALPNTRVGICYCKQKKYTEALPFLKKAVELGDESNQALYFLGLSFVNMKEFSSGLECWEKLYSKNNADSRLSEEINYLKDFIQYRRDYLYHELYRGIKKSDWIKSHETLNEIKQTSQDLKAIDHIYPYVRNRLFPLLLEQNQRCKLAEIWEKGLKDNPTNYTLLHNLNILYYWWTTSAEETNSNDINTHNLWDNLIGYWTSIVSNAEFWDNWARKKPWFKRNDNFDMNKIQQDLTMHLESKILSYLGRSRKESDEDKSVIHKNNLRKLRHENKFVSSYKQMKKSLSGKMRSIPDTYSETLVRKLGLESYIRMLTDLAIQENPANWDIRKINYFLSPFRYIALLIENEDYEKVIEEIKLLPSHNRNYPEVNELRRLASIKLGCLYLGNSNIKNHLLKAQELWEDCDLSSNNEFVPIVEKATTETMKQFKQKSNIDKAIQIGELGIKFVAKDNKDIKSLLAVFLNDRGVGIWNSATGRVARKIGMNDVERAFGYNPDNYKAKKNLSIMYSAIGREYMFEKESDSMDKSRDLFEKALELDKNNEDAKKGIANLL